MSKLVYTAIFAIVALILIGKALNWKTNHDNYNNCIALDTSIYDHTIGNNPYTSDLERQYYNDQAQRTYTNDLNDCKKFLH